MTLLLYLIVEGALSPDINNHLHDITMNKDTTAQNTISILSSFTFSPLEYARGGHEAVRHRALSLLKEGLGRDPTAGESRAAVEWVRLLYDDLKRNSSGGLSVPEGGLLPGGTVSCPVDGVIVRGEVRFSPKRLAVKLIGPSPEPRAERRIMMLAPYIYTLEPANGSPANDLCLDRTKKLLVDLYYDYLMLKDAKERGTGVTPDILLECRTISNAGEFI